jgi:hypothetical protein
LAGDFTSVLVSFPWDGRPGIAVGKGIVLYFALGVNREIYFMTDHFMPAARATITGFVEAVRADGLTVGGIRVRVATPQGLQVHDAVNLRAWFDAATGWNADTVVAMGNPLGAVAAPSALPLKVPAAPTPSTGTQGSAPAATPRSQRFTAQGRHAGGKASAADGPSRDEPQRPPFNHMDSQVKF